MQKGTNFHSNFEGPIFEDFNLYKAIKTTKGMTILGHMDGSASVVLPFESINVNAFQEDDFEKMFNKIKLMIQDLDSDDISVQFIVLRENISVDYDKFNKLPTYLKPRGQYLEFLSKSNKVFQNKYFLSIHCQNKFKIEKKTLLREIKDYFKNKNNSIEKMNKYYQGFEKRATKVIETASGFIQLLNSLGCRVNEMKEPSEYYEMFQDFIRPSKKNISKVEVNENNKTESIRQALFSGVRAELSRDSFILDDYFHRIYTLDRAPQRTMYGKTITVIDSLPFEFFYSITFRKMSHQEALNVFKFKTGVARAIQGGNEGAIVEDLTKTAYKQKIEESYAEFAFGEASGVEISANFCFRIKKSIIDNMEYSEDISLNEIKRRFDQILNKDVFARFGNSEWVSEDSCGWKIFNNILPGMSSMYNVYLKKMLLLADDVPYFLSFYDNFIEGAKFTGVNYFLDEKNNLVPFDLMNPTFPAWNYSISGQTGSGKSVLMNTILTMQFADTKPVVCILDVGGDRGSYTKFLTLTKGSMINLSSASKPKIQMFELKPERSRPAKWKRKELVPIVREKFNLNEDDKDIEQRILNFYDELLNLETSRFLMHEVKTKFEGSFDFNFDESFLELFELKEGECLPANNQMNLIMSVIEVMISSNGKEIDGFMQYDPEMISEFIIDTYEKVGASEKRFPQVTDFLKVVSENVDKNKDKANLLITKLKNWTIDGAYPMFDQKTNIDLNNDVVLADLKGLESEPKLQIIYTLLISQLFNDKMYFTKDRRKFIVRDEAWSLMKNDRARQYFVEDLRTARKNGFATIAISQLPTDYMYPDPQTGRAIMSNMQVNIFCKFEGDAICRMIGQEYKLNDEMIEEMITLGVKKDISRTGSYLASYSKMMMIINRKVFILKNQLHPFEYILYSSSADDNAMIDYYLANDMFNEIKDQKERLESVLWYIAENKHLGDKGLYDFLIKSGYKNKAQAIQKNK